MNKTKNDNNKSFEMVEDNLNKKNPTRNYKNASRNDDKRQINRTSNNTLKQKHEKNPLCKFC